MLGQRSPQKGLFEADTQFLDFVGKQSFYAFLASLRGQLFRDEDFAGLYREGWGRPSVPPSLLATALVLQWHDRVSDEEARERACYDMRWKVALGIGLEERPFAKSTLQEFRAQLVVHKEQGAIFRRSLDLAKQRGRLKGRLRLALDTTNILGRGAVKDTYNLLGDGIVLVLRALARQAGVQVEAYAEEKGFGRYVQGRSVKGQAEIDWGDASQRREFLASIVADAGRLLEEVRVARGQVEAESAEDRRLQEAAALLARVLQQDIEAAEGRAAVAEARRRAEAFAEAWERRYPGAVAGVRDDLDALTAHLRCPREHWRRIRHTNLLERTFGESRRRVKVIGRLPGERSCLSLVWAVLDRTSRGWRGVTLTPASIRLLQELRRALFDPPPDEAVARRVARTAQAA